MDKPIKRKKIHGLCGKRKSSSTRIKMQAAANKRWADPAYAQKQSRWMKKRWQAVRRAEAIIKRYGKNE